MILEGQFIIFEKDGSETIVKNQIVADGAAAFLNLIFLNTEINPFWLGLTTSVYEFDTATEALIAAGEPVGNGYIRKFLDRTVDNWNIETVGGFYRARSKIVTWNATGDWTKAWTRMFLTNKPSVVPPPGDAAPIIYCLSGPKPDGQIVRLGDTVNLAYELWIRG